MIALEWYALMHEGSVRGEVSTQTFYVYAICLPGKVTSNFTGTNSLVGLARALPGAVDLERTP